MGVLLLEFPRDLGLKDGWYGIAARSCINRVSVLAHFLSDNALVFKVVNAPNNILSIFNSEDLYIKMLLGPRKIVMNRATINTFKLAAFIITLKHSKSIY